MLRQRIITGVIVAPIALACVFLLPHVGFSVFVGLVLTVSAWEWANLAGLSALARYAYAALLAGLMIVAFFLPAFPILIASLFWWLIALGLIVAYPRLNELWGHMVVILLIGVLVLVAGFVSLANIKLLPDSSFLICLLFFLIWGADIGAYFSGKAWGKAKLAPNVSPGKSWMGFFGGMVTAVVIAALMAVYFGAPELDGTAGVTYLLVCAGIAVVSVIGDLSISMFKRHRDIKDSSGLLPGHGGFLDRIDSLLAASPVFALYLMLAGWL